MLHKTFVLNRTPTNGMCTSVFCNVVECSHLPLLLLSNNMGVRYTRVKPCETVISAVQKWIDISPSPTISEKLKSGLTKMNWLLIVHSWSIFNEEFNDSNTFLGNAFVFSIFARMEIRQFTSKKPTMKWTYFHANVIVVLCKIRTTQATDWSKGPILQNRCFGDTSI